jgi:hypothetical protein
VSFQEVKPPERGLTKNYHLTLEFKKESTAITLLPLWAHVIYFPLLILSPLNYNNSGWLAARCTSVYVPARSFAKGPVTAVPLLTSSEISDATRYLDSS